MKRRSRVLSLLCTLTLTWGIVPSPAIAAVSLDHTANWGAPGTGEGQFDFPTGVAVDKWGNVYVAGGEGGNQRVQQFTADGDFVRSVGVAAGNADLSRPYHIAVNRWGSVYVTEKGNGGRISRYQRDFYNGEASKDIIDGLGADDLFNPLGISISLDGNIYVSDNAEKVVRITPEEHLFDSWVTDGNVYDTATDQDSRVYAANGLSGPSLPKPNMILQYEPWGAWVSQWGSAGTGDGQFGNPYGIDTDGAGNIFVAESSNSRVQVFDVGHSFLTKAGSMGVADEQFQYAYDVAVGNRCVYVTDAGNNRISQWSVEGVPATTAEVAGSSRYATAVAASKKGFAKSGYVVVATGAGWPDALGGAALAGTLKAPLLLTDPKTLPSVVADEIDRLQVSHIIVLGGESAVSAAVYNELATHASVDIERIFGANRYETSNAIAEAVVDFQGGNYDGTCFVVTGHDFPDALSASPVAAANHWPILLSETTFVPGTVKATMSANGINHGYLIGGTTVLSPAVEADLDATFTEFTRYGGSNRYDTAAKMADWAFNGMGMLWSRPALATGENFPDALAGGVLQGSDYSPLLLTKSAALSPEAAAALTRNSERIYELRFLGGQSAVSASVRSSAQALLP